MNTVQQWTTRDKSAWGVGPWQSEPDKMQWVDEATGLDCLIVRNNSALAELSALPDEEEQPNG